MNKNKIVYTDEGLMYLARLSDGHMRDAVTMLDKCLAYGDINYENITKTLGLSFHGDLKELMLSVTNCEDENIISLIEQVYSEGIDVSYFIRNALTFALDYAKWRITGNMEYCSCPEFCEEWFKKEYTLSSDILSHYISTLLKIIDTIKYDPQPKVTVEAMLLLESDFIRSLANE